MSIKSVELVTTPLSVRVPIDKKGFVVGTLRPALSIKDYFPELQDLFYEKHQGQWVINRRFYHFDSDSYTMYFPRYMMHKIIADISAHNGRYNITELTAKKGAKIEVKEKGPFTPKNAPQKGAIDFLNAKDGGAVRCVTLAPGVGKTVVTFRHLYHTKRRMLVHSSINMPDWVNRIKEWLIIPDGKVVFIQGVPNLFKLIDNIKKIDPTIILIPTQTLRSYMNLDKDQLAGRPSIEKLGEYLGIHTRVIDEYHIHLETHLKLDMRMLIPETVPLTATLTSSSSSVNEMLLQHLPTDIRYEGKVPNYIDIYDIGYALKLKISPFKYTQRGMYNHLTLEKWLLEGGKHFNDKIVSRIFVKLIDIHYLGVRADNQKAVILVASIAYGADLAAKLKRIYPELKIGTFFKSDGDKEPDDKVDILVTTLKSGGTGTDIKRLILVLNTVAVRSSPENSQHVGRCRTIEGYNPRYIFVSWLDIPHHRAYRHDRRDIIKPVARKYLKSDMSAR